LGYFLVFIQRVKRRVYCRYKHYVMSNESASLFFHDERVKLDEF